MQTNSTMFGQIIKQYQQKIYDIKKQIRTGIYKKQDLEGSIKMLDEQLVSKEGEIDEIQRNMEDQLKDKKSQINDINRSNKDLEESINKLQ